MGWKQQIDLVEARSLSGLLLNSHTTLGMTGLLGQVRVFAVRKITAEKGGDDCAFSRPACSQVRARAWAYTYP